MAKVYRRRIKSKDGSFHLSEYYYIDIKYQGNRHQFATKTRSKKNAEEILRNLENRIADEEFDIDDIKNRKRTILFKDLSEEWLEKYSKINNAASQYKTNIFRLQKHLLPYFGDMPIKSITPKIINDFIAMKNSQGSIKESTINRLLSLMSKIYSEAINWDYVKTNPLKRIKRFQESQEEMLYLEKDEVIRLLDNCGEKFFPIASTAVYTGMRRGEICGLKWNKVDLERRVILVEKSMVGRTKTGKSRTVPINKNLLKVLSGHKKNENFEFVFSKNKKGEMYQGDFRTALRNALSRAGIEKRLRFHDLRHTFAANYLMAGGKITTLSKILGHSTLQMTMKYIHFSKEFIESEIDNLDFL